MKALRVTVFACYMAAVLRVTAFAPPPAALFRGSPSTSTGSRSHKSPFLRLSSGDSDGGLEFQVSDIHEELKRRRLGVSVDGEAAAQGTGVERVSPSDLEEGDAFMEEQMVSVL